MLTKPEPPSLPPSPLQRALARKILRWLDEQHASPGFHLVEQDLCEVFGVSRTPIRGALRLLAREKFVTSGLGRGYVLSKKATEAPNAPSAEMDERQKLFSALASARAKGELLDEFSQQELVRRFGMSLQAVLEVLRQLTELELVQRKAGNGWVFSGDPQKLRNESYGFRRALEPQMLLQPGFRLNREWAESTRALHLKFRRKAWSRALSSQFHQINADFHEQLARCSANRYMLRAVMRHNQLRLFLSAQWEYPMEQVYSAIDDHMEILAALENGYHDKAAALMLHHLTTSASQSLKEEIAASRYRDGTSPPES